MTPFGTLRDYYYYRKSEEIEREGDNSKGLFINCTLKFAETKIGINFGINFVTGTKA